MGIVMSLERDMRGRKHPDKDYRFFMRGRHGPSAPEAKGWRKTTHDKDGNPWRDQIFDCDLYEREKNYGRTTKARKS